MLSKLSEYWGQIIIEKPGGGLLFFKISFTLFNYG